MWQLAEIIEDGGGGGSVKLAVGTSSTGTVTCGFRPKYIGINCSSSSATSGYTEYNKSWNSSYAVQGGKPTLASISSSNSTAGAIKSITDTGFTFNVRSGYTNYYFAFTDE